MMTMEELLTPEQVAKRLNISERKVKNMFRAGSLIGTKVGKEWRMEPHELEAYIKRNRNKKG